MKARIRDVFGADLSAAEVVDRVLQDVRSEGDAALRRYTRAFDGAELTDLIVPDAELDAALAAIPGEVRNALQAAAERIRAFHERSRRNSWLNFADGGALGQMIVPIERVGVYAPGGRAAYPSTVLMASLKGLSVEFPRLPVTVFTEGLGAPEQRLRDGTARLAIYAPLQTGAKGLVLSTGVGNKPAQTLYESCGWQRDDEFFQYHLFF